MSAKSKILQILAVFTVVFALGAHTALAQVNDKKCGGNVADGTVATPGSNPDGTTNQPFTAGTYWADYTNEINAQIQNDAKNYLNNLSMPNFNIDVHNDYCLNNIKQLFDQLKTIFDGGLSVTGNPFPALMHAAVTAIKTALENQLIAMICSIVTSVISQVKQAAQLKLQLCLPLPMGKFNLNLGLGNGFKTPCNGTPLFSATLNTNGLQVGQPNIYKLMMGTTHY